MNNIRKQITIETPIPDINEVIASVDLCHDTIMLIHDRIDYIVRLPEYLKKRGTLQKRKTI